MRSFSCFGMLLVIVGVAPVLAGPTGYSVRSNADQHLYSIDLGTGVATDLGLLNFSDAEGLAFAGSRLYAIGGFVAEFWNITSPPGVLVGATGARNGIDAGLDFDETQNKMYNLNSDAGSSSLYEINIANGAANLVGSDTIFGDGLAIDSNGRAFSADWIFTDSLYAVNLANGDLTVVGGLGLGDVFLQSGLAFDPSDVLYALTSSGGIYTLNTGTGQAAFQAQVTLAGNAIDDFEGLAIIPEPSTLALAALGLVLLAVYGRRRKR
ncbi:MAG: PEP-CTERM sorting domain-containing protein [Pirellulales bacterium]